MCVQPQHGRKAHPFAGLGYVYDHFCQLRLWARLIQQPGQLQWAIVTSLGQRAEGYGGAASTMALPLQIFGNQRRVEVGHTGKADDHQRPLIRQISCQLGRRRQIDRTRRADWRNELTVSPKSDVIDLPVCVTLLRNLLCGRTGNGRIQVGGDAFIGQPARGDKPLKLIQCFCYRHHAEQSIGMRGRQFGKRFHPICYRLSPIWHIAQEIDCSGMPVRCPHALGDDSHAQTCAGSRICGKEAGQAGADDDEIEHARLQFSVYSLRRLETPLCGTRRRSSFRFLIERSNYRSESEN